MPIPNSGILILSPSGYPGKGLPLDLTPYIDAQQGQGLDPANATFSERVFSHALLKEGGVLALENLQLKELRFPLHVSAGNRDATAALIEQINWMVNAPGQTVLWQDMGSSQPTFFDLAAGQFDVNYDFRRAGNFWIDGMLRLFVQPLGHTATMRLIASAAGTGPLITLPIASPILGDAPALIQAQVQTGSQVMTSGEGEFVGLTVYGPGYTPIWPAATLLAGGQGTMVGASGAFASQKLVAFPGAHMFSLAVSNATPYFGDTRLIGVARSPGAGTSCLRAFDFLNQGYNATSLVGASDWSFADLGTLHIPSAMGATAQLWVRVDGFGATTEMCALLTLPEANTTLLAATDAPGAATVPIPRQTYMFDGVQSLTTVWNGGVLSYDATRRGPIPKVPVGASAQVAAFWMPMGTGGSAQGGAANDLINASVAVRERARFSF